MCKKSFFQTTLIVLLCLPILMLAQDSFAQRNFHVSAMTNYDLLGLNGPGFDLTLLYNGNWGLRYTIMEDISFLDFVEESNSSISQIKLQGDLKLPMVFKTIDYRAFEKSKTKVFDFLTAYVGVGDNNLELSLTVDEYQAEANTLQKNSYHEVVNSPISAAAFGLYGGERFLVIDVRLLFIKGKTESSDTIDEQYDYETWMMLISLGIGF